MRVLGLKCKEPRCNGMIPLPIPVATAFPSPDSRVIGFCKRCERKNSYSKDDVVDTGYEISWQEPFKKKK